MQERSGNGVMQRFKVMLLLDVNLTGQFLCSREAVREFIRRGVVKERCCCWKNRLYKLIHEVIPWAGHCNYAASRVFLLMKSMAPRAHYKIRVNSIAPRDKTINKST